MRANLKNIEKIMKILSRYFHYTERTTLNKMGQKKKKEAFKILISCLLSLRTKDENTAKVSKALFAVASTPQEIARIPIKKLEKLIYSSGHYKKKARTIKHISKIIIKKYSGKVPDNEGELLSVKGIGRKTANIVLCFAYNKLVIPVDVNVHRVANRLGWVATKNADKTEQALKTLLPKKYWRELNALFLLHGKTICVPISPRCGKCPVNKYCPKTNVAKSR